MTGVEDIISILRFGERLKTIDRTGWILANTIVTRRESVAEHSFGTILSSIIISQYLRNGGHEIDFERITIMATLHDIQESITGDIPRTLENAQNPDFMERKEKSERDAINEIFDGFDNSFMELLRIWNEYLEGKSLEARIVRGADILDMIVHARNLELSSNAPQKLDQFFKSSKDIIESLEIDIVSKIFNTLLTEHLELM